MNEYLKSKRGMAAMDSETQKEVASKGGKAVSKNREHMSAIGKKGGAAVSAKYGREHFAKLGSIGGRKQRQKKDVPPAL